ncbi:hypothetical protein N330309_057 [Synechococcus phage S-CAM1]|jgi:hypothetical protein|uniref:Uncharacterized protein n=1 Tax=Synechococcus phage S-CAM1 TaxID=754037 RepID=A0A1D8KF83_9CAUD|nr:hypothetical protein N330309_057 [Synechococcus phage S-CAM1]
MDYTKHINQTDMTTSFADYVATQDARNDIQLKVREYCLMLCEALEQDFVKDSLRRANFFLQNDPTYREQRIQDINEGKDMYKFTIESGRKYHKIVMETNGGSRSVHCFVNMKTGELHKAASFKAPVKEPRFDLRIIVEREWVFENADWSGGYLYKNAYYEG